jgi:DNA (cytosine-5)-methyltransferase 1
MTDAVDLFAGAGGASLGIVQAGYQVMGYELWDEAVETHRMNRLPCHQMDLKRMTRFRKLKGADLIWASPPCQPFSQNGKQLGQLDVRDCVPDWLRIVDAVRPRLTIMENVPGLLYPKHEAYLEYVLHDLQAMGYKVRFRKVNSADYGTPQTRQRTIVIGRRDRMPKWPVKTHGADAVLPWITMADTFGWHGLDVSLNTGRDWKKGMTRDEAQTVPITRPSPTINTILSQMWWVGPDVHVACGNTSTYLGGHHSNDDRGHQMTIGELAALQGFPSGFAFCGNKKSQAKQIGNAVPPPLARALVTANLS